MYARNIGDQTFTFGVSGKLIRNVLVMYDRETESYWSQLLGEAVEGEMVGTKLEFLPSWMTTWAEWKALHPESLALGKDGRSGSYDSYSRYYSSPDAGVIGETFQDDRLRTKQFVVGVELGDTAVAYPFAALNDQPVLNDEVAGQPLLVVFDQESGASAVYGRILNNQTLTFVATTDPHLIQDNETSSTWDATTGTATTGPLIGQTLPRLKSTQIFWFGWKDFHPDTLVYGVGE